MICQSRCYYLLRIQGPIDSGGQAITMVTHCYKQALSMEKRNHEMEETHCRSTKQLEEEAHMGV